jgi:hypothetical protein
MAVPRTIPGVAFLAHVPFVPVLADDVRDLCQPRAILDQVQHIRRGKKLDRVRRRVAEGLEQLR